MQTTSSPILSIHQKIIVDAKQTHCRLDKFLISKLPAITRTTLQSNIKQGHIMVNQKHIKPSYAIKPQDIITLHLPTPRPSVDILPENIPLNIIYEDEAILIVNKKASMVVHPACDNWIGTLVNALIYHYKELPAQTGNQTRPGLVHRIDKGTSGLLAIAKTKNALDSLSEQLMHHTIERKYLALVWGIVKVDSGTISIPLRRSTKDRRIMQACEEPTLQGKKAITHYNVLKRLGYVTLLECRLETGRTHQIRAHMKYLGHPLFGDTRYGGDEVVQGPQFAKYKAFVHNCFKLLPHQALHAQTLGLTHPTTKEKKRFQVPMPLAFQQIINKWERYIQAKES